MGASDSEQSKHGGKKNVKQLAGACFYFLLALATPLTMTLVQLKTTAYSRAYFKLDRGKEGFQITCVRNAVLFNDSSTIFMLSPEKLRARRA
jgi:hypothetical protein